MKSNQRPVSCLFTWIFVGIVAIMLLIGLVNDNDLINDPSYIPSVALFVILALCASVMKE